MTGSGTLLDPYVIWDVNDLQDIDLDLTAYYELGQDIDATATIVWNGGLGFLPIGHWPLDDFTGNFDGKRHKITNLWISRPLENGIALFSTPNGGIIQNVGLINCYVYGNLVVGALVGSMPNHVYGATIVNQCYSRGMVIGRTNVGGLVGINQRDGPMFGTVQKSFSLCGVEGRDDPPFGMPVGGLVGANSGLIINCYGRGRITGSQQVGGLLGSNQDWGAPDTGEVRNSYATGEVVGVLQVGGLIGASSVACICTDSFWDTETSGTLISDGGTGLTTAQMKTESTFTDAGWDFATIWDITPSCNNDYPCLLNVTPSCGVPVAPFVINKSYALAREEL